MTRTNAHPTLWFSPAADLSAHASPERIVATGVGADGSVVILLEDERPEGRDSRFPRPSEALVLLPSGDGRRIGLLLDTGLRGAVPQPLEGGGLLIVEARRLGEPENAWMFDAEGRLIRRFAVGDGVMHALVDSAGQVWIGYFDEGTVGGGPLSEAGLNRFDLGTGQRSWTFPMAARHPRIFDCYALNVAGYEAWAYYLDGEFNLIQVRHDGRIERWETTVRGAKGVVVSEAGVLLVGTYDQPWAATLWQLGRGRLESPVAVDVHIPKDRAGFAHTLASRGDRIYALFSDACYVAVLDA